MEVKEKRGWQAESDGVDRRAMHARKQAGARGEVKQGLAATSARVTWGSPRDALGWCSQAALEHTEPESRRATAPAAG
jgi:hypothetical protein